MAKTKKSRPPARTKASKRLARYQHKLAVLRQYVAGFDSDKFGRYEIRSVKNREGKRVREKILVGSLYERTPRSEAGKLAKRHELARFNARYRQLRPFIDRPTKRVAPRGKLAKQKIEALRAHAGLPRIRGLRAVPVEVASTKARVTVDRKLRVNVKQGRATEVLYRFPRKPRGHRAKDGRFLTAGEDAIEMLRTMLSVLPRNGQYVIVTTEHGLIPWSGDKGSIVQTLIDFVHQYENKGVAPWLMPKILGVKRVATSMKGLWNYKHELANSRTRSQRERVERKRAQQERAAFKLGKKAKAKK